MSLFDIHKELIKSFAEVAINTRYHTQNDSISNNLLINNNWLVFKNNIYSNLSFSKLIDLSNDCFHLELHLNSSHEIEKTIDFFISKNAPLYTFRTNKRLNKINLNKSFYDILWKEADMFYKISNYLSKNRIYIDLYMDNNFEDKVRTYEKIVFESGVSKQFWDKSETKEYMFNSLKRYKLFKDKIGHVWNEPFPEFSDTVDNLKKYCTSIFGDILLFPKEYMGDDVFDYCNIPDNSDTPIGLTLFQLFFTTNNLNPYKSL